MINRRKFLQNSGALALGSLAMAQQTSGMSLSSLSDSAAIPAGIQLYTVTTQIEADLDGTLKKIASIGYKELESAFTRKGGYHGLKPKSLLRKQENLDSPGVPIIVVALRSEGQQVQRRLQVRTASHWSYHQ